MQAAAAIYAGRPKITLEELGAELKRLRHAPPRGGDIWAASSVRVLLRQARALGMVPVELESHVTDGHASQALPP